MGGGGIGKDECNFVLAKKKLVTDGLTEKIQTRQNVLFAGHSHLFGKFKLMTCGLYCHESLTFYV